ncbi:IclR family transcriptional regulator [Pelomonas sp. KK5]|uniref:IclR family transcriptional regulator n=1 Tax=Pelomonas sp. KK5 TaxID=1855730 RepID=UPI00097C9C97|nr:IclR family transcriptional regulator [Pelomonas sp. KK5]
MTEETGVASVERALGILDALTEPKLTLAELSKRTGLYKSTVLRLTKSLEKFGYVVRADDGCFRLGSKVLVLGGMFQRHLRTADIVPPVLARIVEDLHEGAAFYIAQGEHRICLHRVDSGRAVRDSVHEGDRLPLTVGAAAHVLRAFAGASGKHYEGIRQCYFAASSGERDEETAAVACPVFAHGDVLYGALSVSGPRYRIEALGTPRILPTLFRQAGQLSAALGWDPRSSVFRPHPESAGAS